VFVGREPGGTAIGDQIRTILHALKNEGMDAHTEFLLYAASRAQIVNEVIRPRLAAGEIVICDRFIDSTFAYQGYGRQLDLTMLRQITLFATGGLLPDCTIYLDIDPATALERRQRAAAEGAEWNRLDAAGLEFHERVQAGYEALIAADPGRWIRIKGVGGSDAVQAQIRAALAKRLQQPK
jgi:dTMP kinase